MLKAILLSLLLLSASISFAKERILFLGDSISYQGEYISHLMASLKQTPQHNASEMVNISVPSENASGFSEADHAGGRFPRPSIHERIWRVLDAYKPTIVIVNLGMNDIKIPYDELYFRGISKLKSSIEAKGAKAFFLEPAVHEEDFTKKDAILNRFSQWLTTKEAEGWNVIQYRERLKALVQEKQSIDANFVLARDKIHPESEGHKMMAKAIWTDMQIELGVTGEFVFASKELAKKAQKDQVQWLKKTQHGRQSVEGFNEAFKKNREAPKTDKNTTWLGYDVEEFVVNIPTIGNYKGKIVFPKGRKFAENKPWIWRTEFFGNQPQIDLALLDKGWALGHVKMSDLYGSPKAMAIMDGFYDAVIEKYDLNKQVVLEGFSRGGLYAFNWANANPGQTMGLYVDAPVCDMKSWPKKKSKQSWKEAIAAYGFKNEAEMMVFKGNPVDKAPFIAANGIAMLGIVGQKDSVVPVEENYDVMEKAWKDAGVKFKTIRKADGDHHPHSINNPKEAVEFLQGLVQ